MSLELILSLALLNGSVAALQPAAAIRGDAPVDISANRCEVFEAQNAIECVGTVRVSQGDAILAADKMTIYRDANSDGFQRIEGEGNVRYAAGINAVSGQRATYDGPTTTITVVGDVVVVQGDQVMVGGKLVYNTTTKAMVFTPGSDGRVRGVFNTATTPE